MFDNLPHKSSSFVSFRNSIFTTTMQARLVELITDNFISLFPNSREKHADANRDKTWKSIEKDMNSEFPANSTTVKQLADKWKKLKATAKDYKTQKRE